MSRELRIVLWILFGMVTVFAFFANPIFTILFWSVIAFVVYLNQPRKTRLSGSDTGNQDKVNHN